MAKKRSDGPITVLIVEDEPLLLLYAEDFLSEAGFKTLTAPNADDAIAILERIAEIHIIFTDVQMPGSMDGLHLAEAVRDRWPPIAIVVTSGQLLSALRPSDK